MDGFINSKIEKQSIYEIYRGCRLCGAGAGYKMPIIQNVIDLDGAEVELKQKIRECVQIEVHQNDKMPPLICELCVDKVNDFYEFLEMCRQTNKLTRLRLGLPPQTLPRGMADAGDCILGVTEPIFVNDDSNEPIVKSKSKTVKPVRVKKEPPESRDCSNKSRNESDQRESRSKVKVNSSQKREESKERVESRTLRSKAPSPPPSPPRLLRGTKRSHEEDVSLSKLQKTKKPDTPMPKSILKRERDSKTEDSPVVKRLREKENEKSSKNVKIVVDSLSPRTSKSSPKVLISRTISLKDLSPKDSNTKNISLRDSSSKNVNLRDSSTKNASSRDSSTKNASSRDSSTKNASSKALIPKVVISKTISAKDISPKFKPEPRDIYKCNICQTSYENSRSLINHLRIHKKSKAPEKKPTPPTPPKKEQKPPIVCKGCNKHFVNKGLMCLHSCTKSAGKPSTQTRTVNQKPAKKQPARVPLKKLYPGVDPELLEQLKPLQIRVARCDPLLVSKIGDHYYVSEVDYDFGLDIECVYPYMSYINFRIKSEPGYMVNIQDEVRKALDLDDSYVHWDSEDETDSDLEFTNTKTVESLTSLSLKIIFSPKFIGKVPKKRRKMKVDKAFDTMLNASDFDSARLGIDNIINSLDDYKDTSTTDFNDSAIDKKQDKSKDDNDSLFGDDKAPVISNDDFDSLFSKDESSKSKEVVKVCNDSATANNKGIEGKSILSDVNTVQNSKSLDCKELDNQASSHKNDIKGTEENINESDSREETKADRQHVTDNDKTKLSDNFKHANNNIDKNKDNMNNISKTNTNNSEELSIEKEEVTNSISNDDKFAVNNVNSEDKDVSRTEKGASHLNGQELEDAFNMDDLEDVTDSEVEDSCTMEKRDAQLNKSETDKTKTDVVKSSDLDNISDGEFV